MKSEALIINERNSVGDSSQSRNTPQEPKKRDWGVFLWAEK